MWRVWESKEADARVFRLRGLRVMGPVLALCLAVVGAAVLTSGGVGNAVFGIIFLGFSVWLMALGLSEALVVTSVGIAFMHNFRRTVIPWSAVRGFKTGESRSLLRWPCVVIVTDSGPVLVGSVAGSWPFVQKVVTELRTRMPSPFSSETK